MDQTLEDTLNLESAMGVDFEHSEDVVISQSDIILQHSSEEIPMEFESTAEEHSMLMDTESEEVIVSDFYPHTHICDPHTLQEYILQNESGSNTAIIDAQHAISTQSGAVIDLKLEPQATVTAIKQQPDQNAQPKVITVKPLSSIPASIKRQDTVALTTVPRQVAIAPKPPNLAQKSYTMGKQMAIAPKPVTLVANRSTVKKISIAGVSHANIKGNTMLDQMGKQYVMVQSGAGQKIKLVSSASVPGVPYITTNSQQTPLLSNKNISVQQNKSVLTKLFTVQGQSDVDVTNQPVVITKVLPDGTAKPSQPRYITVQQKSVPLSIGNKVLLSTPSKQINTIAKKQEIISIHAPSTVLPKISSVPNQAKEQKVFISANPAKNVLLKPAPQTKTAQTTKSTNVIAEGQQTQLHQINVPGKGVQYIRLITNPPPPKPVAIKSQPAVVVNVPPKTFVFTDSKGNLIHMSAEKVSPGQSSLVATNQPPTLKAAKATQKLVRIAPVAPKTAPSATTRPSQSLLAPLSPGTGKKMEAENFTCELLEQSEGMGEVHEQSIVLDSKESLRELIQATMGKSDSGGDCKARLVQECGNSEDGETPRDASDTLEEHDLIVIPSNFDNIYQDKFKQDDDRLLTVNVKGETVTSFQSPTTPVPSESDMVSTELGMRPRKACNCTKSQCLKLYCDCFASGEFCNRCNCNNCHNNLENEELRQKAIRGCLDRNPNAFRPKIGKTKSVGPDIVRRHNKGCNCKRSGCLKNYCECYEAKIACTAICKCVGCRNIEDGIERNIRYDEPPARRYSPRGLRLAPLRYEQQRYERPQSNPSLTAEQPGRFMTTEVVEAVCQCLVAVAVDGQRERAADPVRDVLEEFARCLQDVITTAHHADPAHHGQETA